MWQQIENFYTGNNVFIGFILGFIFGLIFRIFRINFAKDIFQKAQFNYVQFSGYIITLILFTFYLLGFWYFLFTDNIFLTIGIFILVVLFNLYFLMLIYFPFKILLFMRKNNIDNEDDLRSIFGDILDKCI